MNSAAPPGSTTLSPTLAPAAVRLDQCKKGSQVRVVDLIAQPLFGSQDDRVSLRLKELGFLPGAVLRVIGFGLMGSDPLAVQVNGTKFALRRAEAAKITVETITAETIAVETMAANRE